MVRISAIFVELPLPHNMQWVDGFDFLPPLRHNMDAPQIVDVVMLLHLLAFVMAHLQNVANTAQGVHIVHLKERRSPKHQRELNRHHVALCPWLDFQFQYGPPSFSEHYVGHSSADVKKQVTVSSVHGKFVGVGCPAVLCERNSLAFFGFEGVHLLSHFWLCHLPPVVSWAHLLIQGVRSDKTIQPSNVSHSPIFFTWGQYLWEKMVTGKINLKRTNSRFT